MSREVLLTILFLASVPAAAALVTVWAAKSERHWFWRALSVWGCVAALVPIRVYEPAMVLGIALPLIVGIIRGPGVIWAMRVGDGGTRLRFGLMDVCLAMVLVGLSLGVLRWGAGAHIRVSVYEVVVPALAMAGLTGAAYWVVVGPRRVIALIVLCSILPLAAWLIWPKVGWLFTIDTLNLGFWKAFASAMARNSRHYFQGLIACGAILLAFVVMDVCGLWVFQPRWNRFHTGRPWLAVKLILGAVAGIWFAWVYWQFVRYRPFPPSADGESQGARILEIAKKVYVLNPWQTATLNVRPLSAHDPATSTALSQSYDELLILLAAPNALPFDPKTDITPEYFKTVALDRLQWQRGVCQSFQVEWLDAESKGDREHALTLVLGNLAIGGMCCRNGTVSECLIGYAFMGVSRGYFLDKRDAFTDEQIARVSAAFEQAEAEHESLDFIVRRDVAFDERVVGWQWRVPDVIAPGRRERLQRKWLLHSHNQWLALNRLLTADLAIRQYRREYQEWPVSLASLAPKYLKSIPIDPFSNEPLLYGTTGDEFVLYSVGPDRVDNGGRLGDASVTNKTGFDMDLDSITRAPGSDVKPLLKLNANGER